MLLSLQDDEKANKNDINEQKLKDRQMDRQNDRLASYLYLKRLTKKMGSTRCREIKKQKLKFPQQ